MKLSCRWARIQKTVSCSLGYSSRDYYVFCHIVIPRCTHAWHDMRSERLEHYRLRKHANTAFSMSNTMFFHCISSDVIFWISFFLDNCGSYRFISFGIFGELPTSNVVVQSLGAISRTPCIQLYLTLRCIGFYKIFLYQILVLIIYLIIHIFIVRNPMSASDTRTWPYIFRILFNFIFFVSAAPRACYYEGNSYSCGLSLGCWFQGKRSLDLCSGGVVWTCCVPKNAEPNKMGIVKAASESPNSHFLKKSCCCFQKF